MPANSTSLTIGGLAYSSYHCYHLYAYNAGGTSAWTDWACTTTCWVSNTVVLFADANYGGKCLVLTGDHIDFNVVGFNDIASSIAFFGSFSSGWEAEVFEHTYYMGVSTVFRGSDPDLGNDVIGDNRASSIRIRRQP